MMNVPFTKTARILSLILLSGIFHLPFVTAQPARIIILSPSAESEAEYLRMTLRELAFFEEYGYQLSLPRHPAMDSLKYKYRSGTADQNDSARLHKVLSQTVFQASDYAKGYQAITARLPQLEIMMDTLSRTGWNFPFRIFPEYTLQLTLYGPGGSYDPETGKIILMTTPGGAFKGYDDPACTLIHEIIHMGIEHSIVRPLNLTHARKERLVDLLVLHFFGPLLPGYRIQTFGDSSLDSLLQIREDFLNLDSKLRKLP